MKLFNLKTAHIQSAFKKLLLIFGLIAVFASVIQQNLDTDASHSIGGSQTTSIQFDKDNQRDVADKALISPAINNQFSMKSPVYFFYSTSYQEPTLLVHQRPPQYFTLLVA